MRQFLFIEDSAHGWLEVDRDDLALLGIEKEITESSYVRRGKVYLEEDNDMCLFLDKMDERGIEYTIKKQYEDGYSALRNYQNYKYVPNER